MFGCKLQICASTFFLPLECSLISHNLLISWSCWLFIRYFSIFSTSFVVLHLNWTQAVTVIKYLKFFLPCGKRALDYLGIPLMQWSHLQKSKIRDILSFLRFFLFVNLNYSYFFTYHSLPRKNSLSRKAHVVHEWTLDSISRLIYVL